MNQLTEFLVNFILEEDKKEVVAIYGGGFKPPTTGHLSVVEQALKQYPEISKFLVYVGSGVRDEIDQEEALLVWEIYKKYLPTKVEIVAAKKPPIQEIYSYAKEHPEQSIYWVIGAREGREDDLEDIKQRTAALDKKQDKYGNVEVKIISTSNAGMSGTNARKALLSSDKFQFFKFIPNKLSDEEKEEIYTILRPAVTEKKDPKKGTGKKPKGSGRRLYTDEDPKDTVGVKFSSRQDIVDTLNKKSFKAKSHARQSQIINLIHQRVRAAYNRAKDPEVKKRLKTALDYAEQRKEASKAKTQRLKKQKVNEHSMGNSIDILPKLAELTQHMIDKGYNIEPLPGLELIDDDVTNAKDFFGKTAYYDPNTQTIVLYTHGRHPKDIARSFAHEMIHHIQNLEGRLGNIQTTNTQEDDYLNDIEAEANLKGTMTFRNWTDSLEEGFDKNLGKDPFGLNQFARELMAEGAYDSLVTQLTKATITKWVKDSKKKPLPKKSFVDIDIDDVDGKGREIEFNYVGIVEFDKKIDGYEVDGTSNSGEDKGKMPFVATMFRINPKILPQAWSKISADVSDVIRHEIEHLTQAGDNVRGQVYDDEGNLIDKGKYMEDDIMIRDMINKLKILPKSDYYKLEKEVDAMLQGLYLKAKKTRKPFADVIDQYLDIAPGIDTKEDKEAILNLWRSRRGALSLPVFENEEKVMDYKIYLDMDGVLADFDKRFEDLAGMPPRKFEDTYGKNEFWDFIDEKNKLKFWIGIPVMDGAKKLVDFASKYDYELLTAPSAKKQSRIGKILWVRNHTKDLFGSTPYINFKRAKEKHEIKPTLTKSDILVDDRDDTIQRWNAAGGTGILYTSADQVINDLKKLGL